jgi:hypothetical protein
MVVADGNVVFRIAAIAAQGIFDFIVIRWLALGLEKDDVWVELEKFLELSVIFSKLLGTHGHRNNLYVHD